MPPIPPSEAQEFKPFRPNQLIEKELESWYDRLEVAIDLNHNEQYRLFKSIIQSFETYLHTDFSEKEVEIISNFVEEIFENFLAHK